MESTVTHIRALGSLDVIRTDGIDVTSVLRHRKAAALLAYLFVARQDGWHSRDTLLSIFWPEDNECRGRASLRQALYRLRKELGGDVIVTKSATMVSINRIRIACDVTQFEAAIAADELERALACYHGPFLDGIHLSGAWEFERWVDAERRRLERAYGDCIERLAARAVDPSDAVKWWQMLSDQDPYNARITMQLMKALEATGNRASAILVAERHAKKLQNDLEASPDDDVAGLADQFRRGTVQKLEYRSV